MTRKALAALAMAACALAAQADARPRAPAANYANPGAVIGAEIAFAQMAQEKGQWTAFRENSSKDAVMFVPQRVNARDWLKGKADPPVAVKWQTHEVWTSCDGSYAVTRGAWQRPNGTGFFTTVWQRQPRQGGYKWVLDLGDAVASPLAAPDMIPGHVAECTNRPRKPAADPKAPPPAIDPASGLSDDGSLRWTADLDARGGGTFKLSQWNGSAYDDALVLKLSPQG